MLIEYKKANIYQSDSLVLEDVCFEVEPEQFVYVIGKRNAEKAEVLGRNLLTIKRREVPALRREMGVIFQDFQLLHDRNIYKNLEFVLRSTGWKSAKEIDERIDLVLDAVGMKEKKMELPHELSGGEQQRIAIARALLNHPKIIIADEPTGNLDPETAEKIVGLLYEISHTGETSVVISTHNHSLIDKFPGRVYRCADGKLTDVSQEYSKTVKQ